MSASPILLTKAGRATPVTMTLVRRQDIQGFWYLSDVGTKLTSVTVTRSLPHRCTRSWQLKDLTISAKQKHNNQGQSCNRFMKKPYEKNINRRTVCPARCKMFPKWNQSIGTPYQISDQIKSLLLLKGEPAVQ
jgi:hypothetical protein